MLQINRTSEFDLLAAKPSLKAQSPFEANNTFAIEFMYGANLYVVPPLKQNKQTNKQRLMGQPQSQRFSLSGKQYVLSCTLQGAT